MSELRTLDDLSDVAGKTALVRVDFNVPIREDGSLGDDTRLRASLPTVMALSRRGAVVLLISHLGRPNGKPTKAYSLAPVARTFSQILGRSVRFIDDWAAPSAKPVLSELEPGDVALLENTRFYAGEESNASELATKMAEFADFYVNDAFSASHRAHASTVGVANLLPSYLGRALQAELEDLRAANSRDLHPAIAIVGGAKISSKLHVLEALITRVDHLVIGGAMANTFLAARGMPIGKSLAESELEAAALRILEHAEAGRCQIHLPQDVVVARELVAYPPSRRTILIEDVSSDELILDLGPLTTAAIDKVLQGARLLVWNGPLGAFETPPFDQSTSALARAVAKLTKNRTLISLAGGGDTVAALKQSGVAASLTHVSTGGGAFLEWIAGFPLPALQALDTYD